MFQNNICGKTPFLNALSAHASGFMNRDGRICSKFRKRGDLKMQQLSWVDNMTKIIPLAARQ
jgi:hypothetical protein